MTYDTLIHNGIVLTVNPAFEIFCPGFVGIRSGRIAALGPEDPGVAPLRAETCIDARGGIIMPGLVNTHTHLPMTLFRGLADDLPLETWLNDHIFPAERRHINPATVGWGARLACAEMLLSGTTTCCDGYFLEDRVAAAVADSGMRAVLGQGVIDFAAPGVPDPRDNIAAARDFLARWRSQTPLITPAVFCHSPYTCSAETLRAAKALAAEHGALFQIHAAETRQECDASRARHGASPIAYLDRLGLLTPGTLLVHCVWADDRDIARIAAGGAAISHNPQSNMKLASGIAPVTDFLAAGITVGLGTDGCASNNDLDMLHEMDTAAKLHKVRSGDPTACPARTVVEMATIRGARAVGLGAVTGSLEIGKAADITVLAADAPHLVPVYHPASQVVYAARGDDVREVLVAGRRLVVEGRLQSLDAAEIRRQVTAIAREIRPWGGN
ncbi:MAG TPA: amidohydrolase [Desulfobacterales bacterium]|nr:amidohydrolase [Desulfobacterales bacterium]